MDNEEFWKNRVETYGHTGWADTGIYAFDQDIRLNVVSDLVGKNIRGGISSLLDFGCGTGDFTKIFLPKSERIVMYDPCKDALNAELLQCEKVDGISDIEILKGMAVEYDVILSITVLQHIMKDDELIDTLSFLRDSMKDDAILLIMESFGSDVKAKYERNWDCKFFSELMEKMGFELMEACNFYDVQNNESFRRYYQRADIKLLNLINRIFHFNTYALMRKIAARYNSEINDFIEPFSYNSGSKFMVYKKI